jgi:hypothetical protein
MDTKYVLLPLHQYEQMQRLYEQMQRLAYDDSDPHPDEFLALAHEAFADDWDAPGMDDYQDYDRHRPQP